MDLTPPLFELMDKSFLEATKDTPHDVGISVALWRMQALMKGYRYALEHGYHGT